ncbi:hypothetical protein JCM10212_002957 [Sporobolomyces blumeae]
MGLAHRAAIRAAAVATYQRPLRAPPLSGHPSPSQPPRPLASTSTGSYSTPPHLDRTPSSLPPEPTPPPARIPSPALDVPRPPFVALHDSTVFAHESLTLDIKAYRLHDPDATFDHAGERIFEKRRRRRIESYERHEHFGRILAHMTITELVMQHYPHVTIHAVQVLTKRVHSIRNILELVHHYDFASRLVADSVARPYLQIAPRVLAKLFYAYVSGLHAQEGIEYAQQWVRQCFRPAVPREYEAYLDELNLRDPARRSNESATDRDAHANVGQESLTTTTTKMARPRRASPLVPEEMPLLKLDAYLKQNEVEAEWTYAVRGEALDQVFKAEVSIEGKTAKGSGITKQAARQSAAEAFLRVSRLDDRQVRAVERSSDNYARRLYDLVRKRNLPKPEFETKVWEEHPRYIAHLKMGSKRWSAIDVTGKLQARKEVARLALAHYEDAYKMEPRVRAYCREHHLRCAAECKVDKALPHHTAKVRIHRHEVGADGGSSWVEVKTFVGRGMAGAWAMSKAFANAAEAFNVHTVTEEEIAAKEGQDGPTTGGEQDDEAVELAQEAEEQDVSKEGSRRDRPE